MNKTRETMNNINRGKQFEQKVRESFEKIGDVSVDRIPDQTSKYKGSTNICDFMVYKNPHLFYIECKSVHGNTLPFLNIRPNQWNGLLEKSKIPGVVAGVMCWWVDCDTTKFIPIQMLEEMKNNNGKSIRYDVIASNGYFTIEIKGTKKRVFFDYDMRSFLDNFC